MVLEPTGEQIIPVLESWSIESFTSTGITLQLNFSSPLLVSAFQEKDLLEIRVVKEGFFSSISNYQFVEKNYTMQARPLPQILRADDSSARIDSEVVAAVMIIVLVVPLALMWFMQIEMGRVWSLFLML